jgi:hypothetical protein
VRQSDAFDDDTDHWGVVQDQDERDRKRQLMCLSCSWWLATRTLFLLMVVLFIVWTGKLGYG